MDVGAFGLQRRKKGGARVRREVVAWRGGHAERERETRDRVQAQGALMVRVRRGAEALVGVRVRCGAEVLVRVRVRRGVAGLREAKAWSESPM